MFYVIWFLSIVVGLYLLDTLVKDSIRAGLDIEGGDVVLLFVFIVSLCIPGVSTFIAVILIILKHQDKLADILTNFYKRRIK